MVDVNKLLGSILKSGAASGFAGGLAGGLASKKMKGKTVKKMGSSALKLGGVAAVGALAYTAYKSYNSKQGFAQAEVQPQIPPQSHRQFQPQVHQQAQPQVHRQTQPQVHQQPQAQFQPAESNQLSFAPPGSAYIPEPDDQAANDALGLTLVRAMIAVARADGRLDAQESQLIFQKIESLELDPESQNLLVQEMGHPVDIDAIVNSASCPEVAAEIYIASLLAVQNETVAEKSYLAMLAARMQLPPQLVTELEHQVSAHKISA